ncbi:MAG: (deoxy)nucleoside triphosphate pyrophosphohydrolase [Flavobacteriia bacterium]|nr:(deoxy)nucleoside triphosphate pyrophosphohydrolase [Flavobacteriia bacterium]
MKKVEVVAAVIEHQGKFLCVQRGKSTLSYISEKWEFPGGKIELGETEQETIEREIFEELCMHIEVGPKLMVVEHAYPDFNLTMHTYRCISNDQPILTEHLDFRWLGLHELSILDWAAADLPIVAKLCN